MAKYPRDKLLLDRLAGGDEGAFRELVEKHHSAMLRVARGFVSSEALAEEVVQETWLAVINGLSRFEGRSSLKTWIFRILTNRAKTRGIREGRSMPFSALPKEADSAVEIERFNEQGSWIVPPARWDTEAPEELVLRQEVSQQVERAIAELPSNQASVLILRDIQGWSSEEVCDLLEISESNQRVLLHRARGRIRKSIDAHFRREDES